MKRTYKARIVSILLIITILMAENNLALAAENTDGDKEADFQVELSKEDTAGNTVQMPLEEIDKLDNNGNKIYSAVLELGESAKIKLLPSVDGEEYLYQFSKSNGSGMPEIMQAYDSKDEYTFTPEIAGEYMYIIEAESTSGIYYSRSINFTVKDQEKPEKGEGTNEPAKEEAGNQKAPGDTNLGAATGEYGISGYSSSVVPLKGEIKSNKTQYEYADRGIVLTANVLQGNGSYTYKFSEEYGGTTKVVQDTSTTDTYRFSTSEIGEHIYYADITDGAGEQIRLSYKQTVVAHPDNILKGIVSSNKTTVEYENRSVTLTANVGQGYGGYQYQFTEVYGAQTKVVQAYSSAAAYRFTTKGEGKHTYYVDIKDSKNQTLRLSYTMTVVKEPVTAIKGTLTSNKSTAEYENRSVTLTAGVSQGNGGYQYQFTEVYGAQTKVVQAYSSAAAYRFTTKGEGKHTYYVDIKDSKNQTLRLSYTMTVVKEPVTAIKGTLTSNKSTAEYENRSVTLTAGVSQGNGGYQYQFTEVYGAQTKVVQAYSSAAAYRFTTKGEGKHTYYVDIKDSKNQTLRLSYTMTVVKEPAKAVKGTLTSSKTTSEYVNRSVVLTANVTQGNGNYQYQYTEVYNGVTKIVQSYSDNAIYRFSTSGVGKHIYYVDIIDAKNQTLRLSYTMTVAAHPDYELTGKLSSNKTSQEYVDRGITLTAEVLKDGYGECTYQFSETFDGNTTVLQDFSTKKTFSFTTAKVGTHVYYVTIKDKQGQTFKASFTMKVSVHPDYVITGTLTSNKTTAEYSNRSVTLTAAAKSGYGDYTYRFVRYYNGATKVMQNYSSNNRYTFTTGLAGKYTYYVDIKDRSGAVARVSYSMTVVSDGSTYSGIDVSSYQGSIDWKQVKNSGISFAMLRILSGTMTSLSVDSKFNDNIKGATDNGISVGVYRYGYAMNVKEAQQEAKMVVDTLKKSGYRISFPVAYDVEDANTQGTLAPSKLADIINAFKVVIENNGYKFMIYSGQYWLESKLDMTRFAGDDIWVARWRDNTPDLGHGYKGLGNVTIWQYSSEGKVPGISGNVDMDIGYVRY